MRIIADHSRGAVNLIADGVVPSNEDRGYVLRRIMRRAIQQGRVLGLEPPFLGRFAERAIELMSGAYPHLAAERATIERWVATRRRASAARSTAAPSCSRAWSEDAKEQGTSWIDAEDAFQPPRHLRLPLRPDQGAARRGGPLGRRRGLRGADGASSATGRAAPAAATAPDRHEAVISFVGEAPPSRFVGYEKLRAETSVAAAAPLGDDGGAALVKLEESPFYAEGGGQVADSGVVAWDGAEAKVEDVYRVGDDQAIRVAAGGRCLSPASP